jgi:pSer/pThr/pTyr-binding forkhead associated (FHA) protein
MAHLSLLDDNGTMARKWELGDHPVAVGRGETADVRVEDQSLSRRHFLITREGGNYHLKDLDSQNGTWVDGRRAASTATRLKHHDCIAAGRTLFLFSEGQPSSETYTQR